MFARITFILLPLVFPLLCSGCQRGSSSPIPVAPDTSPSAPVTEVPASLTGQYAMAVPHGKPLAIDGAISPGEWDNARVETFSDGSELLLMYDEGYLYLGVRANTPEMIGGNVFIDHGSEIAILHVSAALGTALYEKGMDSWQQTQGFVWRCRRTDSSEVAQAERDAFLGEEHWVAANSRMGSPNELEYQIEMSVENLRLAVSFIRASNPDVKTPWPKDLDDDCIKPTPGEMPDQLRFSPDRWATVAMPYSES